VELLRQPTCNGAFVLGLGESFTGDYLKPFREDKSVRFYEMIDYIVNQTDERYPALRRHNRNAQKFAGETFR
jgi:hypothetical protein